MTDEKMSPLRARMMEDRATEHRQQKAVIKTRESGRWRMVVAPQCSCPEADISSEIAGDKFWRDFSCKASYNLCMYDHWADMVSRAPSKALCSAIVEKQSPWNRLFRANS